MDTAGRRPNLVGRTRSVPRLSVALLALALASCSNDDLTQPATRPAPAASLDRHGNWGQRGRLVTAELLNVTDPATVRANILATAGKNNQQEALDTFDPTYDVEHWRITYTTVGFHGEIVVVSGAVYIPVGVGAPLPLVSVSHGTVTSKTTVPSNRDGFITQAQAHASHGSVAVFADYLGYGADAADFPLYLLADINASTSLDALRAVRRLLKQQGRALDGRLFISGYSQGGQVAMALARMLESDPRSGFRVTAAAPQSGPYDLYESARASLADTTRVYVPWSVYFIYAVAAYQQAYQLGDLHALLTDSAAVLGDRLMSLGMESDVLARAVPKIPSARLLRDDLRHSIMENPNAPMSRALRTNQTYAWRPSAPLRMYYGEADIDVYPAVGALRAVSYMVDSLGVDAALVDVYKLEGPGHAALNHNSALWPAIIKSRVWFDTFAAPAVVPEDPDVGDEDDEATGLRVGTQTLALAASRS